MNGDDPQAATSMQTRAAIVIRRHEHIVMSTPS